MRPIKCKEHKEIFEINKQGQKQWIQNWNTYLYLGYKKVEDEVDIISLEDLRAYPVGKTKIVKTVTKIEEGEEPRELFYPDEPEVTPRQWVIAGTCMNRPDWYEALGYIGFTHVYHNRACGMDMDRLEQMGIKVIINYTGEDEAGWLKTYTDWGNKPVCGGSWLDDAGHEPDITRKGEAYESWIHRLEVRIRFCKFIRDRNSDVFNNPVVEMMDNTGDEFPMEHPGWKLAFSEKTHNVLLVDIYPNYPNAEEMIVAMERSWNKFIRVYPHQHQVIIQMCAYGNSYWPGYIRTQYDFWKGKMASIEFENPYKTPMGVCWYKQETWMQSEEMMDEMKIVADKVTKELI